MMTIGVKFKNNEVFVPEVLVAARAMNAGLTVPEPRLVEIGNEPDVFIDKAEEIGADYYTADAASAAEAARAAVEKNGKTL